VWINRCGVLAGAGQFGTAEQGIFSYWLHAHAARLPLRYIGFGGLGYQVRDAFHPCDLAELIRSQFQLTPPPDATFHAGGGLKNSMSLAQLTDWCNQRFGPHTPDCAKANLGWEPKRTLSEILDEIAGHVSRHPDWLQRAAAL
jgi:CDP-paratose 2-epimerase